MKISQKGETPTIEMLQPSDGHVHVRQDVLMALIIWAYSSYLYAVCMGNTSPPITDNKDVNKYRQNIMAQQPIFVPVMTVMLNEKMLLQNGKANKKLLGRIYEAGARIIKFIPAGTSTNAVIKITLPELIKYFPVLEFWATLPGTIFSIHLELINTPNNTDIPELERETEALSFGKELIDHFGGSLLNIAFEHASTSGLIQMVEKAPNNIYASLTTQHATITYDMVRDPATKKMLNPHLYCMPIAKTANDVKAVRKAMTSKKKKFYFGSDCAPHFPGDKMGEKPKPGIFTPSEIAIPVLCKIFEEEGKLGEELEYFASAAFINFLGNGHKHNGQTITLAKERWQIPDEYNSIVPFMAGQTLDWKIVPF